MNHRRPGERWAPLLGAALALACNALAAGVEAASPTPLEITVRGPESPGDTRYDYDTGVLRLALEKTRAKHGAYRITTAPPMNFSRAIASASTDAYPNFFIKLSYEARYVDALNMDYVRFPVDLGIVGYRVCFTHPDLKPELAKATSLEALRRFTHGQGRDWADVSILRNNGFKVIEVDQYESLFRMVAARRFDLFCRGTNELLDEYTAHKDLPGLSYDESFSIAYPLPRFFYTHRRNTAAIARIQEGIRLAHKDGSLQVLWREKYGDSVDLVRLEGRRIFWIENPLLEDVDFDYRQYFFDPLKPDVRTAPPNRAKGSVQP